MTSLGVMASLAHRLHQARGALVFWRAVICRSGASSQIATNQCHRIRLQGRYQDIAIKNHEYTMIRNPNTESTQFIQSLKVAGIAISKEPEVIERLEEAREWHYAFTTLVKQGQRIGINFFATPKMQSVELQRLFAQYQFAEHTEATFEASLLH